MKVLYDMNSTYYGILGDAKIAPIVTDVGEAYFVFCEKETDKLHIRPIESLRFDCSYSSVGNPYVSEGRYAILNYEAPDVFNDFVNLITKHKQIQKYEEQISQLKEDLRRSEEMLNNVTSHNLYLKHELSGYRKKEQLRDSELAKKKFALWVDDNAKFTDKTIVLKVELTDDFFCTPYWTQLFTEDTRFVTHCWETPNNTYDGYGCNHQFIVVTGDCIRDGAWHLKWYPEDDIEIIDGTEDYMYKRLNEIWNLTYGADYPVTGGTF